MQQQDWHATISKAAELYRQDPTHTRIAVITSFQATGDRSEMAIYKDALAGLRVPSHAILRITEGNETLRQLEVVEKLRSDIDAQLTIISTCLHYPRVRWLCRGKGYQHHVGWGIPRPKEAITDILLAIAFPLIIDPLGLRDWFTKKVVSRRASGTFW
jgi:hypothetical protein